MLLLLSLALIIADLCTCRHSLKWSLIICSSVWGPVNTSCSCIFVESSHKLLVGFNDLWLSLVSLWLVAAKPVLCNWVEVCPLYEVTQCCQRLPTPGSANHLGVGSVDSRCLQVFFNFSITIWIVWSTYNSFVDARVEVVCKSNYKVFWRSCTPLHLIKPKGLLIE